MDTEEMKDWIYQNLMIRSEIIEEYEVKLSYIDVAISRVKIKPFIKRVLE
ncbi:hypothetical protein MTQ93_10825 [Staphylococcus agnetis]|nr:hypothetical protein [Staphylococcus agnetis]MCO4346539.1 hypothetical protein [Staphylococcus agnetis]